MRLTTIRNGSKLTISASGWLGLLQMVSKSNTRSCANEDVVSHIHPFLNSGFGDCASLTLNTSESSQLMIMSPTTE